MPGQGRSNQALGVEYRRDILALSLDRRVSRERIRQTRPAAIDSQHTSNVAEAP
jgi:hypothetical protein